MKLFKIIRCLFHAIIVTRFDLFITHAKPSRNKGYLSQLESSLKEVIQIFGENLKEHNLKTDDEIEEMKLALVAFLFEE